MLGFVEFLAEAARKAESATSSSKQWIPRNHNDHPDGDYSRFRGNGSDEHAFAAVWNHMANNPHLFDHHTNSADLHRALLADISRHHEKANHSLSLNAHDERLRSKFNAKHAGKKNPPEYTSIVGSNSKEQKARQTAWHELLTRAARTVADVATHPEFKHLRSQKAEQYGDEVGQNSKLWNEHGVTDTTSKSDVIIGNKARPTHRRISLKHGDAQILSAQPESFLAVLNHAAHNAGYKRGSSAHDTIMAHGHKIAKAMRGMADVNYPVTKQGERTRDMHLENMNTHWQNLSNFLDSGVQGDDAVTSGKQKPGHYINRLKNHMMKEAITGHGQFGKQSSVTPTHLVTYGSNGTSIKSVDELTPENLSHYQIRLAKGKGRGGKGKCRPASVRGEPDKSMITRDKPGE